MLTELRIENLLLIERAELRFGPGLTAITGETGAGKTMLAHAIDLLLGGKQMSDVVRPGASEAYVEGSFEVPDGLFAGDPRLEELGERIEIESELVLARRVGADGRSRAFVGGRSAAASDLRELGGRLLSFYGQHEHRKLTVASAQLAVLDAFCGEQHLATCADLRERHRSVRELESTLERLTEDGGERAHDILVFELEEIEALGPSEEDRERLTGECARLRSVDALRSGAGGASDALVPDSGEPGGALAALAEAEARLSEVVATDSALVASLERLSAARIDLDDLGGELRAYVEGLAADPVRLEESERRLEDYTRLERKHGGDVGRVLAHADECRSRLEVLSGRDAEFERLRRELAIARSASDGAAATVSAQRSARAPELAKRVLAELGELALDRGRFEVTLIPREDRGPAGDESVEFLISPNPGVAPTPLRETASGGELSRTMLALMSIAAGAGPATLVFDEVDAGVGGLTAKAVGHKLRSLGSGRQVVCITHLPQIASLADAHFRIEKDAEGDLARTVVTHLDRKAVEEELVRMLGAETGDAGARKHVRELLRAA